MAEWERMRKQRVRLLSLMCSRINMEIQLAVLNGRDVIIAEEEEEGEELENVHQRGGDPE